MRQPIRLSIGLLLSALALGCALTPPDGPPPPLPAPSTFANLRFGTPGLDAVQALNRKPPDLVSPTTATSPDPAAVTAAQLPYAQSGGIGTPAAYSLDAILGRPEVITSYRDLPVRRALMGVKEAILPGFGGAFPTLRAERLDPLVASWAPDAKLVRANVSQEELQGGSPPPRPICVYTPVYGPPWDVVYVSESKQEALRFFVDDRRILVLHLSWQRPGIDMPPPPVLTPGGSPAPGWPPVGREAAVSRLAAALRTPGTVSEEERARWNYFHSLPHAEPSYYADEAPNLEPGPVYELPASLTWNASLQQILGRWVWVLQADAAPSASPSPAPATYRILCTTIPGVPHLEPAGGAFGMVDAESGTVIRFTRPARRIDRTPG